MINRSTGFKFVLIAFVFSFLLIIGGCGSEEAKVIDPPRIAEYNKPGTVYVETIWNADVTVTNVTINETALYDKLVPQVLSGALTTEDQIVAAIVNELLNNPAAYIIPGAGTKTMAAETGGSGSGFIITPDGYVVTNAHVVKKTDDELKQSMALTALSDLVEQDIADLETALGIVLSEDQSTKMAEALASAYAAYLTVSNQTSQSQLFMGVAIPGLGTVQKGLTCEIVKVGETSPGKDVAILKVNANNLPTVPLGDDASVREGDQAIALGYPGAATFNPLIKQSEENIKPSLTVGSVSGRKTMPGGWEVLQIDTAVTHGNSGGPLFNNKGEVIGITTFGSVAQNTQTGAMEEVQGFNFAVPTTVVKQFLGESNITPTQGPLTKTYHEAVDLASEEHYSAAKDKFKEVADSNQGYPYVNDQISLCTAKINEGLDKSTFPIPIWLIIVLLIIVLAVVVALVLVLLLKPKKKPAAAPMPSARPAAPAPGFTPPAPQPTPPTPPVAPPAAPKPDTVTEKITPPVPPVPGPAAPAEEEKSAKEEGKASGAAEQHHFCAFCGAPLPPDAKFCSSCAKPVE